MAAAHARLGAVLDAPDHLRAGMEIIEGAWPIMLGRVLATTGLSGHRPCSAAAPAGGAPSRSAGPLGDGGRRALLPGVRGCDVRSAAPDRGLRARPPLAAWTADLNAPRARTHRQSPAAGRWGTAHPQRPDAQAPDGQAPPVLRAHPWGVFTLPAVSGTPLSRARPESRPWGNRKSQRLSSPEVYLGCRRRQPWPRPSPGSSLVQQTV